MRITSFLIAVAVGGRPAGLQDWLEEQDLNYVMASPAMAGPRASRCVETRGGVGGGRALRV
jgi:hypothetical protein